MYIYKLQLDVPGPGTYEPKIPSKCVASISDAPFGVRASRSQKITAAPGPAPCEYHTDFGNLAYESQKRFKQTYRQPIYYKHADNTFTSDDYQEVSENDKNEKCEVYHAAFKSRTARFHTMEKVGITCVLF
ncbi:uncharacterized protein LOC143362016 [Halictus rubicundus]|uniref:uncharacterized protein LOC143362016 n=1 Tax=Halictus rubicundus TaxID=77578 RepID=UPI0040370D6D